MNMPWLVGQRGEHHLARAVRAAAPRRATRARNRPASGQRGARRSASASSANGAKPTGHLFRSSPISAAAAIAAKSATVGVPPSAR